MSTTTMNRNTGRPSPASGDVNQGASHSNAVMRQTQGVIGVVLLAGVAATYLVDPIWIVVPLIVGLGLAFAGASGMCPMALLIARMPWNKSAESDENGSSGCCGGRCG